jgi:sulfate transport system ATP-binding protein
MGFLGPVTTLRGRLVRPHDIHVGTEASPGAERATLDRVVSLGFETRIVATPHDGGDPITVQLTRNQIHELALNVGDTIYLSALPTPGRLASVPPVRAGRRTAG